MEMLANKTVNNLLGNRILAKQQKGVHPGSRGTKNKLLLDRTASEDSNKRQTQVCLGDCLTHLCLIIDSIGTIRDVADEEGYT